jgi:hypothetical protein
MLPLSARVPKPGRIDYDSGSGFRANPSDFEFTVGEDGRGGTGDNEGSNKGGPHSSSGFRRALMHTERNQGKLAGAISSKLDTSGPGFRKPNYFAQGARRHGLHMGSGAPVTTPAMDTGMDTD